MVDVRCSHGYIECSCSFVWQGRKEKTFGLKVSPCCDPDTTDVPKCQEGFISFLCRPLFEELAAVNAAGGIVMRVRSMLIAPVPCGGLRRCAFHEHRCAFPDKPSQVR